MNNAGHLLPNPAVGALCMQWMRHSNKPGCKCAQGELHGPYFYQFVRVGGRLHKRYVRQADVPQVRAAYAERRRL
ncbi:MAG: hypothetical protein DCC67_19295 [Planctomycetota bacterium]|nr:MAG: hypothetical protein DCC67_19295 [Planctomycetota bacterium]